jgi:hypothetical protein
MPPRVRSTDWVDEEIEALRESVARDSPNGMPARNTSSKRFGLSRLRVRRPSRLSAHRARRPPPRERTSRRGRPALRTRVPRTGVPVGAIRRAWLPTIDRGILGFYVLAVILATLVGWLITVLVGGG